MTVSGQIPMSLDTVVFVIVVPGTCSFFTATTNTTARYGR